MTIYQLECFIAVAEELNFSAAAERKIAPTLVESTMPSSTATRRAFRQSSSTVRGFGR